MKIFIADETFSEYDNTALKILSDNDDVLIVNDIQDAEGIIAGTEPYDVTLLKRVSDLKVISRMGVGYDGIDLNYCKDNNIIVTYTPEAPAGSVADLTIAQMLNMTRFLPQINASLHKGEWFRPLGKKLSEMTIGVIGVGRIGQRVIKRLIPFSPKILACDIDRDKIKCFWKEIKYRFSLSYMAELLKYSDIVTVHIPMSDENDKMINKNFFSFMKNGSYLINTSRGGILDEQALENLLALSPGKFAGVALDVFETEPYDGRFSKFNNVLMTSHMGSMTLSTRIRMEVEAVTDCIRVLEDNEPINPIPEMENISSEYTKV